MKIEMHQIAGANIAEVLADEVVINSAQDGLDLIGALYFEDCNRIILHQHHIAPGFFDLSTGLAGDLLQKFTNYRVRVAIIGDFTAIESRSLRDFIRESNQRHQINFTPSREDALQRLSQDA